MSNNFNESTNNDMFEWIEETPEWKNAVKEFEEENNTTYNTISNVLYIIGGLFIVCSIIGIFVGGFKIMKSHRYYGNSYEGYLFLVASISCFVTSALFFAYGEIIILNQKILNLLKDKLS